MTDQEMREMKFLEKTCGTQPFNECAGDCLNPDDHDAKRGEYLILKKKAREEKTCVNWAGNS